MKKDTVHIMSVLHREFGRIRLSKTCMMKSQMMDNAP